MFLANMREKGIKVALANGSPMTKSVSFSISLRPRLGGGNGMEWKGIKRIILEYSSLPFVWEF